MGLILAQIGPADNWKPAAAFRKEAEDVWCEKKARRDGEPEMTWETINGWRLGRRLSGPSPRNTGQTS
jgi:hypothetical protein